MTLCRNGICFRIDEFQRLHASGLWAATPVATPSQFRDNGRDSFGFGGDTGLDRYALDRSSRTAVASIGPLVKQVTNRDGSTNSVLGVRNMPDEKAVPRSTSLKFEQARDRTSVTVGGAVQSRDDGQSALSVRGSLVLSESVIVSDSRTVVKAMDPLLGSSHPIPEISLDEISAVSQCWMLKNRELQSGRRQTESGGIPSQKKTANRIQSRNFSSIVSSQRGKQASKVYHIFVSHCWDYGGAYERLIRLLRCRQDFQFKDYSIPRNNPVTGVSTDKELYQAIKGKMSYCSVILVPAGVYATYREWIKAEIEIAAKGFSRRKPIIAIRPWRSKKTSVNAKATADRVVGWTGPGIVKAIKELAK